MSLLTQLRAKQKRDVEEAAKRRAARIAKKVTRAATRPSGLDDLPLEVAVAIEEAPARPEPAPAPPADDSVPNLVARLTAIRERIWRLQAVYAVSLSHDAAIEADRYVRLFQDIAEQLRAKDATALDALTRGHESLLLSPPIPVKQTIPAATQNLVEMRWEAMTQRRRQPKPPTVPDGLDWMIQ